MDGIAEAPGGRAAAFWVEVEELRLLSASKDGARDAMEAHRLAHALNGALLEAAGAACGVVLAVGDPDRHSTLPCIWTAVLRSDPDGPGGTFVMVAPDVMTWGMPESRFGMRSATSWDNAVAQVVHTFADAAAAGLPVAVRTGPDLMVVLDRTVAACDIGVLSHFGARSAVKVPLAYRMS